MEPLEHQFYRDRLTALRKRLGIPLERVSEATAINYSTLSRWQNGWVDLPEARLEKVRAFLFEQHRLMQTTQIIDGLAAPIAEVMA